MPGQASAIAVSVSGANSRGSVGASDQGGGRYTATYTPEKAGTDQVQVRVSGTAVPGSPFASAVQAGDADPGSSQAVVPACVESDNLPVRITITAFDAFGNRVTRGGDDFQIRVSPGTSFNPTDNGDGTYTAQLNLDIGVFRIDITLDGEPIKGSPYQILVPFPFFGCQDG